MTHPEFHALCAELLDWIKRASDLHSHEAHNLMDRARAALAAPQQGAPTDEAINVIFDGPPGPEAGRFVEVETDDGRSIRSGEWSLRPDGLLSLRITRYGGQVVPVAVAERLPGEGDCDAEGRCWVGICDSAGLMTWSLVRLRDVSAWVRQLHPVWLPHWALPLPEAQP